MDPVPRHQGHVGVGRVRAGRERGGVWEVSTVTKLVGHMLSGARGQKGDRVQSERDVSGKRG